MKTNYEYIPLKIFQQTLNYIICIWNEHAVFASDTVLLHQSKPAKPRVGTYVSLNAKSSNKLSLLQYKCTHPPHAGTFSL